METKLIQHRESRVFIKELQEAIDAGFTYTGYNVFNEKMVTIVTKEVTEEAKTIENV